MPEEAAQETVVTEAPQGTPEVEAAVEAPVVGAAPEQFTVKVNGEDVNVTLEEALKGYQRQSDYTQKTQSLAQEREQLSHAERLWEAIEANPEATLKRLAAAYDVDLGTARQMVADAAQSDPFAESFVEPQAVAQDDPRWKAVEEFMQTQQAQTVQAQVEAEAQGVKTKYNVPNLSTQDLVQYAVDNGINNLDAAFRSMSFEAVQQQAGRTRKQAAKGEIPPIAGGHPVQAGALVPGSGSQFPTLEEAASLAEQQLASS